MALNRILVAQDQEESQVLRTDNRKKFIVNGGPEWQFLFGPDSVLSNSTQVLKIAVELDPVSLESLRFTAYLYNPTTGTADAAATCVFAVYLVTSPGWYETLITSFSGSVQSNGYFYATQTVNSLTPASLDGETTLMIEADITRLAQTYKERVYVNHLGVYESVIRLRKDVQFLQLTKQDE